LGGIKITNNRKFKSKLVLLLLMIVMTSLFITGCSKQKVSNMEYNGGMYTGEVSTGNMTIGSITYNKIPNGNGVLLYSESGMRMDGFWQQGLFTSPHRKSSLPIGATAVIIATILGGVIGFKAGAFEKIVSEIIKLLSGNSLPSDDNQSDAQGNNEGEEDEDSQLKLQLNKTSFTMENGNSDSLNIRALLLNSKGEMAYAPNAEIEILCEAEGIEINPSQGKGEISSTIFVSEQGMEGEYSIEITSRFGEKQVIKYATIRIIAQELEVKFESEKHSIKPDKGDWVNLHARLKMGSSSEIDILNALPTITFEKSGKGSEWLDISESDHVEDWTVVRVEASNPTGEINSQHQPPEKVSICVSAVGNDGKEQSKNIYVSLIPYPTIELTKQRLDFLNKTNEQLEIEASMKNASPGEWTFFAERDDNEKEIASFFATQKETGSAVITVQELGVDLDPDVYTETMKIKIYAKNGEETTDVKTLIVSVSKEGLYISQGLDKEERLNVIADKDKDGNMKVSELDFVVLKWNSDERRLVSDLSISSNINISEPETEDGKAYNLFNVTALKKEHLRERVSNTPSSVYGFSLRDVIPGEGREVLSAELTAKTEVESQEYEVTIPLKINLAYLDKDKKEWTREYENLKKIINEFLPEPIKTDRLIALEAKKDKMGAMDLKETRNEYWNLAYKAIMAEKKMYDDKAYWADKAVTTLEWTAWIGDRAFASALSTFTGPVGGYFITQFKEAAVDFIVKLEENPTKTVEEVFDEWFWARVQGTIGSAVDGVVTSKAKPNSLTWVSMFFVYKVSWHYGWDKDEAGHRKGLTDAIFSAAWDVAGTGVEDAIGPWAEAASKGKGFKIVFV
jgi:hypothetical protein